MSATVTKARSGDAAVVAVTTRRATAFLCRSLTTGAAFGDHPVLLLDLRRCEPLDAATRQAVDDAGRRCMARHQWFGTVEAGGSVPATIAQARRWQHVVHNHGGAARTSWRVAGDLVTGLLREARHLARP